MYTNLDLERTLALVYEHLSLDEDTPPDEYPLVDELPEIISDSGKMVFDLYWDSGGLGAGAGNESVFHFCELYFFFSLDFGLHGPFDDLDAALRSGLGFEGQVAINECSREITCSEWSVDELIGRLNLEREDLPVEILLNGEYWPLETLEFRQEQLRGECA